MLFIRKEKKEHGRAKQVEGPIPERCRAVLVDDVATSGGSLVRAAHVLKEGGHEVVGALVLVDRQEGAAEALMSEGIPLLSVFELADIEGK